MALKPDRQIFIDTIEYFANNAMERGGVVCQNTTGSSGVTGAGMDSSNRVVAYQTNPSGLLAIGVLLWDVVNVDLSRQILNPYKAECQVGSKVAIAKRATVVTNMWLPQALPSGGMTFPATVYVGGSGLLGVGAGLAASGYPVAGRVLTALDSDGYAEVDINL